MAEEHVHEQLDVLSTIILTGILGAIGFVLYLVFFKKELNEIENSENNQSESKEVIKEEKPKKNSSENLQPKKKIIKESNVSVSHPLLLTSLKGHTGTVNGIEFSSNGKYLVSCAEDRTARLWSLKDINAKDHKYTRVNIEFDHASAISVSPDSRAFIVSLAKERKLRVYKINKKKDSTTVTQDVDFPKIHKTEIINVGISSNGKFIMSADNQAQVIIWSLKGDVYECIDTLLVYNTLACISPCGNLVAACGFTSEVKLWHIKFTKNNEFNHVSKGLELKGHKAGVLSFSFSNDSKRMGTISKDGTWKVWDIDVNYLKGQEAYLIHTGQYNYSANQIVHIALSHDYFTVAIAIDTTILLYDANSEKLEETIENIHQSNITGLAWHAENRHLYSAGGADRSIRVWHNPVGVKAHLNDLKEKLPKAKGDAMKERIKQQIAESMDYLTKFN